MFINRLDIVNLHDQSDIIKKQIRNIKMKIESNSLTLGKDNTILFLCKSLDTSMIVSWNFI